MGDSDDRRAKDSRSTSELIDLALREEDNERYWELAGTLEFRGTREVFESAVALCRSSDSGRRRLGANILSELGYANRKQAGLDRPYRQESVPVLLSVLDREQDPDVICAVLYAASHLGDPGLQIACRHYWNHPSAEVREALAFALCGNDDPKAIRALIHLSRDQDANVRDWATFGLGTRSHRDTKEIRRALWARVDDPHFDTRSEAIVGLALRNDRAVIAPLIRELQSGEVGELFVGAAKALADPSLLDGLVSLRSWWDVNEELLEEAIETCQLASAAQEDERPTQGK